MLDWASWLMHRNVFQKRKNFSRRVSCASKLAGLRVGFFFCFLFFVPFGVGYLSAILLFFVFLILPFSHMMPFLHKKILGETENIRRFLFYFVDLFVLFYWLYLCVSGDCDIGWMG